jgi:predicted Fe-Mo cluster-binding NifX family protein
MRAEVAMKIAIASDDGKTIASHFGRTRGFVIVEAADGKIVNSEYRPNTFTGHATGAEGESQVADRHGPILSALADCQVVVARGMGRRIYDDLAGAGIEVFVTTEALAEKAAGQYLMGKLVDNPDQACDHSNDEQ